VWGKLESESRTDWGGPGLSRGEHFDWLPENFVHPIKIHGNRTATGRQQDNRDSIEGRSNWAKITIHFSTTPTMSDYDTDEWNTEDDLFQEVIQLSEVKHVRAAYREARESRLTLPPELRRARFIRFMDLDVGVRRHIGEFVGHRFFRVAFRIPVKKDDEDKSGYFLPDFNANVLRVYNSALEKRTEPFSKCPITGRLYLEDIHTFFRPPNSFKLNHLIDNIDETDDKAFAKEVRMRNYFFRADHHDEYENDGWGTDWHGYKLLDIQAFGGELNGKGYLIACDSRSVYPVWYLDADSKHCECPAPYPGMSGFPIGAFSEVAVDYNMCYYPFMSYLHFTIGPDIAKPNKPL